MTEQPSRVPYWLQIDLLIIVVSIAVIGVGLWIVP